MSDSILWRLVWKEYRTQRAFWLSVAGLAVLCQVGWLALRWHSRTVAADLFAAALVFAALYALGCAATLFAAEREDGTLDRLRALAAPPGRVLAGKLGFAAVSTAVLTALLWTAAWMLAPRRTPAPDAMTPGALWALWGVSILEMLGWGLLFSVLVKRPLHAACFAAAAGTCVALVQLSSSTPVYSHEALWEQWMRAAPMRLSVAGAVLVLAATAAWWRARGRTLTRVEAWLSRLLPRADRTTGDTVSAAYIPPRGPLGSLVWHERRQATKTVLLFALAIAAVLLLAGPARSAMWAAVLVAVGSLMGSCTFLAEQEGRRFRFLAHQGVSPRRVWLSKHLVWMPAVALAPVVVLLLAFLPDSLGWHSPSALRGWRADTLRLGQPELLAQVSVALVLAYAAGQFVSMLIPRGLVAAFVGLVLTGVLVAWQATMAWLEVNPAWSVVPLSAILLVATWVRAPDWMLERLGWRAWSRLVAAIALPVFALLVAVASYRVYEIPGGGPGFSPNEYLSSITPAHRETAALYRRALGQLQPLPVVDPRRPIPALKRWQDVPPELRGWLQDNAPALDTALEAARRPTCLFYDPSRLEGTRSQSDLEKMRFLSRLVLLDGVRLESEGQLDEALQRYLAVLHMAAHVADRAGFYQRGVADSIEAESLDRLVLWTAHKDQTSQRIVGAIKQWKAVSDLRPAPLDALKSEYLFARNLLYSAPLQFAADLRTPEQVSSDIVIGRLMPWERARTLRLLDAWCALHVADSAAADRQWQPPLNVMATFPRYSAQALEDLTRTTPYATELLSSFRWNPTDIATETRRRAVLVILAIKAWQLQNGALPASLEALVGTYLDEIPPDPFSGRNFHYQSKGFPTEIQFAIPGEPVPPGRPLLWSSYPGNTVLMQVGVSDTGLPVYAVGYPNTNLTRKLGWGFVIPSATARDEPAELGGAPEGTGVDR